MKILRRIIGIPYFLWKLLVSVRRFRRHDRALETAIRGMLHSKTDAEFALFKEQSEAAREAIRKECSTWKC